MAKSKYGKYVITETPKNVAHPGHANVIWIHDELKGKLKGAFYLECDLVTQADTEAPKYKPHNHDFDEYLVFLGTDPKDPSDLGAEVEIWLGDEKHAFNKSCAVFVPKGLYHTPLIFKRVDRPIVMFRTGNTVKYRHLSYDQSPRWQGLSDNPPGLPE
jgi:hypothetical protein